METRPPRLGTINGSTKLETIIDQGNGMEQRISFFDAIESNKRNSVILLFVMFVLFIGIVWAFSYIFKLGVCGPILGLFALIFYTIITWTMGDRIILAIAGAKEATREQYPFIYNVVEGLSIASGVPQPKIYVIQDDAPNAFATGRDPQHASVAVTTGLLNIMKKEELEGVLAHEMSHIANYDIRFTMIAVVFIGAIALLSDLSWRSMMFGSFRGGGGNKRGGGPLLVIAIILLVLGPIAAELVRLAISRQREYLADANAAKLTRYPDGLASALLKIEKVALPVQNATNATAPLYISNPKPGNFMHLFSTHPQIADRVARLKAM